MNFTNCSVLSSTQILDGQGESLVAQNHMQQMITFTRGAGVEFVPIEDQGGVRKAFIDDLANSNRLELQIPAMIAAMVGEGRLLLELFPNGRSHRTPYRIKHYRKDDYRVEFDEYGDLSAVKYRYSFKSVEVSGPPKTKWVQQRVTAQTIETAVADAVPNLDQDFTPDTVAANTLGYVPYVEVLNPPPAGGELGESDFAKLLPKLETHDDIVANILDNLDFFSTSPLVTSHDSTEVTEKAFEKAGLEQANSVAYASGFKLPAVGASRRQQRHRRRLRKVIGGIDPANDQFVQLNINPVPQDHVLYADQYERQLREALGGILERGIETATESRVVYGKVASTAKDKQAALFKYGLCELFSLAILAEEARFLVTGGQVGLPPLGDRSVSFRVGAVFLPTAEETLKRSIVGRNLQRLGTNAKETLKFVYPDKTEGEIEQMVGSGGLPSEYIRDVMGVIQQLSGLIDPLTQLPVSDPATGLPLLYTLIPFLTNALAYGQQFTSTSTSGTTTQRLEPAALSAAQRAALPQPPTGRGGVVSGVGGTPDQSLTQPAIPGPGATSRAPDSAGGTGPSFFNLTRSPILRSLGLFGGGRD